MDNVINIDDDGDDEDDEDDEDLFSSDNENLPMTNFLINRKPKINYDSIGVIDISDSD